jgi:DNA-binding PadR family transcriptional regulator
MLTLTEAQRRRLQEIVEEYSYRSLKAVALRGARKQGTPVAGNIRYLQRLVLEFASRHVFVTAAGVREYAKQRYGIEIDLRRIHDAIVRLVKRGLLEKVAYGVYRLTQQGKNALAVLFNSSSKQRSKELEFKVGGMVGNGVGGSVSGSAEHVFARSRLHVRGAVSLEDLARQLYALYRVVGCALSYLRLLLGENRFRRAVRDVGVACADHFIGGHGTSVLGRSRSLRRPLIDLSYFISLGLAPKEIGIDVLAAVTGLSRLSVKAYFG